MVFGPELVLFLCSQKELGEKQAEMVKTTKAAENAINKLQLNTVSIEVNTMHDSSETSCHITHRAVAAISGTPNPEVSDSPKAGGFPSGLGGSFYKVGRQRHRLVT